MPVMLTATTIVHGHFEGRMATVYAGVVKQDRFAEDLAPIIETIRAEGVIALRSS